MELTTTKPCTIYIEPPQNCSGLNIRLRGEIYYFRPLKKHTDILKINLNQAGTFLFSQPVTILRTTELTPSQVVKMLPTPERDRVKNVRYFAANLNGTPARIFTKIGVIQYDPKQMKALPLPCRRFIMLHELAHMNYKTEWKCDLKALHDFCAEGWNASNAFYTLMIVLKNKDSEEVKKRINNLKQAVNYTHGTK